MSGITWKKKKTRLVFFCDIRQCTCLRMQGHSVTPPSRSQSKATRCAFRKRLLITQHLTLATKADQNRKREDLHRLNDVSAARQGRRVRRYCVVGLGGALGLLLPGERCARRRKEEGATADFMRRRDLQHSSSASCTPQARRSFFQRNYVLARGPLRSKTIRTLLSKQISEA